MSVCVCVCVCECVCVSVCVCVFVQCVCVRNVCVCVCVCVCGKIQSRKVVEVLSSKCSFRGANTNLKYQAVHVHVTWRMP